LAQKLPDYEIQWLGVPDIWETKPIPELYPRKSDRRRRISDEVHLNNFLKKSRKGKDMAEDVPSKV
jgi:hypothetical protein